MNRSDSTCARRATFRLNAARSLAANSTTINTTDTISKRDQSTHPNLHGHTFVATVLLGSALENTTELQQNVLNYPERIDAIAELQSRLDHTLLNDFIDHPSDANIANYIFDALSHLDVQSVHLTSAPDRGVYRNTESLSAWQTFQFEAAHQLPNVPDGHKCGRMHGHSFYANIFTPLNFDNIANHPNLLDNAWQPIKARVNYKCLNDIAGLENPTSENLASWIWHQTNTSGWDISRVEVLETPTAGCSFTGNIHTAWKDFSIDCALGKKTSNSAKGTTDTLFGHTYHVRAHIECELDPLYGWTMDFADIKNVFQKVANQLDHYNISETLGLSDNTALANYLATALRETGIPLCKLDVDHNPGQGIVVKFTR